MKETLFFKHLPEHFQIPSDAVGLKMLKEYGAMFVAKNVTPPDVVIFKDEAEVQSFQNSVKKSSRKLGEIKIELQTAAMDALNKAIAEALSKSLSITPRNADSAKRSYRQTVENWASRVNPGLEFWLERGKITLREAEKIRSLSPPAQIPEIFKLEEKGISSLREIINRSFIRSHRPALRSTLPCSRSMSGNLRFRKRARS